MKVVDIDAFDLFEYAKDLIRTHALQNGAPVANGQFGPVLGRPVYIIRDSDTLRFEHVNTADTVWACFSKDRTDPETMPIGFGRTISEARDDFLERYEDQ